MNEFVMSPRRLTVALHFKHKMCGHFVFHETLKRPCLSWVIISAA